jgi:TetR/AcrR family transcriptional regulator, transcriptional repressor for nem operon
MRYGPEHKQETHRRIVQSASRQFRTEGVSGPGVVKLMNASGLTQGGFYKHFKKREDLLIEALAESFASVGGRFSESAAGAPAGEGWKLIVKQYLSLEHCQHPENGCPMAALAPEIARSARGVRKRISSSIKAYREQLTHLMPGKSLEEKDRNFVLIFSSMMGAVEIARTMTDPKEKQQLLDEVRDHLLASF